MDTVANEFFSKHLLLASIVAFSITLIVGLLLVRCRSLIDLISSNRRDEVAVQASHVGNPLRLGGVAVIAGFVVSLSLAGNEVLTYYTLAVMASLIPILCAGIWEDLGHGVSSGGRFFASLIGSGIAVSLLGVWIARGDLGPLDIIMGIAIIGIASTVLFGAIFCHAVNLIDGMNGLASVVIIFSSTGLAVVSDLTGQREITFVAITLCASTFGFTLLNWPRARLFLGDAGAYSGGHILVWLAIGTISSSSDVAVPAILLILFYPLADTLHTVFRRILKGRSITSPDRMHLHQKIRRAVEITLLGANSRRISNPITTLLVLPMVGAPVVAGTLLWDEPIAAWGALVLFFVAFSLLHLLVNSMARRFRNKGLFSNRSKSSVKDVFGAQYNSQFRGEEISWKYSGLFIQDAVAVDVVIARSKDTEMWTLICQADNAVDKTWNKSFETDLAAWEFFLSLVERFGMDAVLGPTKNC